jgi:lipopolysaccharide transport system ATP-binding protein
MSDIVIRVENLSKKYILNHAQSQRSGDGLRHALQDAVSAPLRWMKKQGAGSGKNNARITNSSQPSTLNSQLSLSGRSTLNPEPSTAENSSVEEFYALRDVSFEIKRGEVLGIIGRNGAGKSTLLKILSRITEPTSGRIGIKGRIASLLEVGTGFHPELTGRENIYLNGAILGMSRVEVKRKFDQIVAFAEVEKFLDTPVKRFSSGMYVRLAFAVAAHLEPEILIVDEVLAVGDAEFQKKCLGKMQDVAGHGRTVLFVSHNLTAVRQLCTNGLLLQNGQVVMTGIANEVADRYLQNMLDSKRGQFRLGDTGYTNMRLVDSEGMPIMAVLPEQEAFVELGLCIASSSNVQAGFTIYNQLDVPLVLCASEYGDVELESGDHTFRVRLPNELLQPGTYRIEGAVWDVDHVFQQDDYLYQFQVMPARTHEMHGRSSSAQFVLREPWHHIISRQKVVA